VEFRKGRGRVMFGAGYRIYFGLGTETSLRCCSVEKAQGHAGPKGVRRARTTWRDGLEEEVRWHGDGSKGELATKGTGFRISGDQDSRGPRVSIGGDGTCVCRSRFALGKVIQRDGVEGVRGAKVRMQAPPPPPPKVMRGSHPPSPNPTRNTLKNRWLSPFS